MLSPELVGMNLPDPIKIKSLKISFIQFKMYLFNLQDSRF